MSAINCPVCHRLRKIEIVYTSEGWVNPPCYSCGDPGWTQPLNSVDPFEGRKEVQQCEGPKKPT